MWRIEYDPEEQALHLRMTDHVSSAQMRDLADSHARALEHTAGEPFKVLMDLRGLFPLESEAVALMGALKRVAASLPGCQGFAVLADSPTVAMQQRRTRVREGEEELITLDPEQARRFLIG